MLSRGSENKQGSVIMANHTRAMPGYPRGVLAPAHSLDVAATLAQAKEVLNSHRDWMKTRTRVAPLAVEDERGGTAEMMTPGIASLWIQAPPAAVSEQVQSMERSSSLHSRGGARSRGKRIGRPRSSRVAPLPIADAPSGSPSDVWTSYPSDEAINEGMNRIGLKKKSSLETESVPLLNETTVVTKSKTRKKGKSRNSIAPAVIDEFPIGKRTIVPDVFFSTPSSSITALPLVSRVRAAWTSSSHSLALSSTDSTMTLTDPATNMTPTHSQLDFCSDIGEEVEEEEEEEVDKEPEEQEEEEERECGDGHILHSYSDHHLSSRDPAHKQNYKEFVKQLQSASTGTVIAIAPAPKHHTTSYKKHKHSMVGSEREPVDSSEEEEEQQYDKDSPVTSRSVVSRVKYHNRSVPDSTVVAVLPKKGVLVHVTSPAHLAAKQNIEPGQSSPGLREAERTDREREGCELERSEQKQMDAQKTNNKTCARSASTDVQVPITHQRSSTQTSSASVPSVGDLMLEDIEDEIYTLETQSHVLPPFPVLPHTNKPSAAEHPPMVVDNVEESAEKVGTREKEEKLYNESRHFSSKKLKKSSGNLTSISQSPPSSPNSSLSNSPSTSSKEPQKNKKRKKQHRKKLTPVEQLTVAEEEVTIITPVTRDHIQTSLVGLDTPQQSTSEIENNEGSNPPHHNLDTTEVEQLSTVQIKEDDNLSPDEPDEVEESQLPPLLRVKSITSLASTTDFKFTRKRQRDPPPYSLHHPAHAIPAPPCPAYGTVQPTEVELVKAYSKVASTVQPHTPSTPSPFFSSSPDTRKAVDEGIQTSPVVLDEEAENYKYTDDQFLNDIPSSTLSLNESDVALDPGELHLAARNGNLSKIRDLLCQGHDVNTLDGGGYTPLMYCVLPEGQGVQLHCADLLIRRGANLDCQAIDGSTALHLASYVGALSLIQLLLFNGANPNVRDCDGRLALHWATKPLTAKPIAELLKYSVSGVNSTDSADMTLLMWAAHHQNPHVLQYLLSRGADVEEKDMGGETAMHWSVHEKETCCLELLLQPDMTYFKDHLGKTVMHKAASVGSRLAVDIIASLRHDTIHDIDKKGHTPLHYSAVNNKVDVCYLLLSKGADATQRDFDGKTALDYAREHKYEYVVALFTCHETSVADFTRLTRIMSHASSINRSTSLSDLADTECQDSMSVMMETLSIDQADMMENDISQHNLTPADIDALSRGSYLGYFPRKTNDPPRHYYFWVKPSKATLCWSRSDSRRNKKEAHVYAVYTTASHVVAARPDFSPQELHRYAFWVTTDIGVLDLLAYTEQAYRDWVKELQNLAQQNSMKQNGQDNIVCNQVNYDMEKMTTGPIEGSVVGDHVAKEKLTAVGTSTSETALSRVLSSPATSTPTHNSAHREGHHNAPPPLDPYQVM